MSDVDSIPEEPLDALLEEPQEEEPEPPGDPEDEATEAPDDADKKPVKPKRIVRNPRPKLNEETLKTPRGLTAIQKCFERVKFKGPGNEDKDLDVLLKTYEYWCHRLFPKYPFDACIERLEKLGTKRTTHVYLKQIRMGIVDDYSNVINSDKEDENIENVQTDGLVDEFDRIAAGPMLNEEELERIRRNREQAEERRRKRMEASIRQVEQQDLTEEQLERIRINKEKAEMLRKKRLQAAEVTQEEDHENAIPSQKHKRLQILDSDEETEETLNTSATAQIEINAESVEDAPPLDQIMDNEELHENRSNKISTAVDRNEETAETEEDIQFNKIVEDSNEDIPTHNKKRKRCGILNSDEEMEETQ